MTKNPRIQIDLAKVEQAAQVLKSDEKVAEALGISYSTLRRRKAENEQFEQALKRGKAKADLFVGSKLMEAIKAGNITAIIFYLKTQCGWRETQKTEIELSQQGEIPTGLEGIYKRLHGEE